MHFSFKWILDEEKLHSFLVSHNIVLKSSAISTASTLGNAQCAFVCVYMCLRVCMCVHIYCMYISSFTTVMSIPNIERNRIGRADDGSKFCVQSPLESPGQKKWATKTQISCKILTRIAA